MDQVEGPAAQPLQTPERVPGVPACARQAPANISYQKCRTMLKDNKPYVLALGTAWGLSQEFISAADYVLEPIAGKTGYNHLSVRSAAAIIFDRLMG